MNQLTALVERNHATIRPARGEDIQQLGESLGFALTDEYVDYLAYPGPTAPDDTGHRLQRPADVRNSC